MNIKYISKKLATILLTGSTLVSGSALTGCVINENITKPTQSTAETTIISSIEKDKKPSINESHKKEFKVIQNIKAQLNSIKNKPEELDLLKNKIVNFINNEQTILGISFYELTEREQEEIITVAKDLNITVEKTNKTKTYIKTTKVDCVKTVENDDGSVTEYYNEYPVIKEVETYLYNASITSITKKPIAEEELITTINKYFSIARKSKDYKQYINSIISDFINGFTEIDKIKFYDLNEDTKTMIVDIAKKNGITIKPIKTTKKAVEKTGVNYVGSEMINGQEVELYNNCKYEEEIDIYYYMAVSPQLLIDFINDNIDINNIYFNNLDEKTKDEIIQIAKNYCIDVLKVEIGTISVDGKEVKVYDYLAKEKENIPPKLYVK